MEKKHEILMCKPDYYAVDYIINPWMQDNLGATVSLEAMEQWERLYQTIATRAEVHCIDPVDGLPDMVFTANAGLVLNGIAMTSRFRPTERQGEEPYFYSWLRDRVKSIHHPPESCYFEGCGDALPDSDRRCIWLGYGIRSDMAIQDEIESIWKRECIALELVNPSFYHLDTCLCPLPDSYIMYYPEAFSPQSQELIRHHVSEEHRIEISHEDATNFVCNAVNIAHCIIINRISPALRNRLEGLGFEVIECPVSEFIKGGGATRCMILRLDEDWSS